MRKKFTTTLSSKTLLSLQLIKDKEEMVSKNDVIEYLVREYIRENGMEEIVNDAFKKD